MQYLLDNDIKDKGEYQLTNALENMKNKGSKFTSGTVNEWMDCGNKNVTLETNGKILGFLQGEEELVSPEAQIENSTIVPPVFIGPGAKISNSTIGPRVSIGANTTVSNSTLSDVLIQEDSEVLNANLINSMIGNKAKFDGKFTEISIGDYVLTGGELPALCLIDSISRKIDGTLGKIESAEVDSFANGLLEYPQYTKPREYRGLEVPEVLLNGNHAHIEEFRYNEQLKRTKERRPDLYEKYKSANKV